MWLVYLRLDDHDQVVTMHVRTGNKTGVGEVIRHAEQRGLTATAKLVEYASFYASGTIKIPQPNSRVLDHSEFMRKWNLAANSGDNS